MYGLLHCRLDFWLLIPLLTPLVTPGTLLFRTHSLPTLFVSSLSSDLFPLRVHTAGTVDVFLTTIVRSFNFRLFFTCQSYYVTDLNKRSLFCNDVHTSSAHNPHMTRPLCLPLRTLWVPFRLFLDLILSVTTTSTSPLPLTSKALVTYTSLPPFLFSFPYPKLQFLDPLVTEFLFYVSLLPYPDPQVSFDSTNIPLQFICCPSNYTLYSDLLRWRSFPSYAVE